MNVSLKMFRNLNYLKMFKKLHDPMTCGGIIGFYIWIVTKPLNRPGDFIDKGWECMKYVGVGATFPISIPTIVAWRKYKRRSNVS